MKELVFTSGGMGIVSVTSGLTVIVSTKIYMIVLASIPSDETDLMLMNG